MTALYNIDDRLIIVILITSIKPRFMNTGLLLSIKKLRTIYFVSNESELRIYFLAQKPKIELRCYPIASHTDKVSFEPISSPSFHNGLLSVRPWCGDLRFDSNWENSEKFFPNTE